MRSLLLLVLVAGSAAAAENDLSVAWIARTPRIDYVWASTNPTVEGWPAEGADVQWVANVRWLGDTPLSGVPYSWTIDGDVVKTGTLDFGPQSIVQTALPWKWTFTRHEIAFEINTDGSVAETNSRNNRVLVYSNALGVGLYVERTYWNGIAPQVQATGIGATTFDDWMQKLVRHFNEAARYALYPDTPNGVADRWRIDDIHIVEDGTLPLVPPYTEARNWGATTSAESGLYPNVADHTVDMQWGFPAFTVNYYPDTTAWTFMLGNSTVHEWSHARTMIDTYAWNISTDTDQLHMSSPPQPKPPSNVIYSSYDHGMMHFNWARIDPYTAAAMNQMTGRRAVRGNYNEPWDLGWFLDDLPTMNRIHIVHLDGSPVAGQKVSVYMARPITTASNYGMSYFDPPDLNLTTDANGVVSIPRTSFPSHVSANVDRSNGTAVVRINDHGTQRWAYIETLDLNMAYWRGNHDTSDITITADAPACNDDTLGPSLAVPVSEALVTTADVTFQFPNSHHHYDIVYAVDGGDPVSVALPVLTGLKNTTITAVLTLPRGRIVWWIIDNDTPAPCPLYQSSLFTFDHTGGFPLSRRRAVQH